MMLNLTFAFLIYTQIYFKKHTGSSASSLRDASSIKASSFSLRGDDQFELSNSPAYTSSLILMLVKEPNYIW